MEVIDLPQEVDTPRILLNQSTGEFELSGKSYPEDVRIFFTPVLQWLRAYVQHPNPTTTFKIEMSYFNTATSKVIFEMLSVLEVIKQNGGQITVNWHYDEGDEDMYESGKDYQDLTKLDFNFVLVEDDDPDEDFLANI